jgi:hypothetical protein
MNHIGVTKLSLRQGSTRVAIEMKATEGLLMFQSPAERGEVTGRIRRLEHGFHNLHSVCQFRGQR